MTSPTPQAPSLVLVSDLARQSTDPSGLQRSARSGQHHAIRRGVYVPSDAWHEADEAARYLAHLRAVAATRQRGPIVFSHYSAALLWGIPILGRWPQAVHLLAAGREGVHSKNGVVWHRDAFTDDEICEVDGVLVTSLMRTLVDLATTSSFASAVVSLDHGIKPELVLPSERRIAGIPKDELLARMRELASQRGVRKATEALVFADAVSGSPGESLSRVQIHVLRFPPPLLQVRVPRRELPGDDIPDFTWKRHFGEFDGYGKYVREEYTHGRSTAEVVIDEKVREDRLRQTGRGVIRWDWAVALDRARLRARLIEGGLQPLSEAAYRRVSPLAAR